MALYRYTSHSANEEFSSYKFVDTTTNSSLPKELKNSVILPGLLNEAKGLHQEALKSFRKALDVDPTHVPSLISTACILRQLGSESLPVLRSFLTDALRIDRTNSSAWYNLGLLYKADHAASALEAAECFEAAALLEESTPIEPFR